MDFFLAFLLSLLAFCWYMLIRNVMVGICYGKFIDYFYHFDGEHSSGKKFSQVVPSYDEMMFKFWVWPLSSFYPAYHNRKR